MDCCSCEPANWHPQLVRVTPLLSRLLKHGRQVRRDEDVHRASLLSHVRCYTAGTHQKQLHLRTYQAGI